MNLREFFKTSATVAALGFSALAVHAQLNVNEKEQGPFDSAFAGDVGSGIAKSVSVNANGTATSENLGFGLVYRPLFGPAGSIPLNLGALNLSEMSGLSDATAARTFSSGDSDAKLDFDNKPLFENEDSLTGSLVGVAGSVEFNYAITPVNGASSALIDGARFGYNDGWSTAAGSSFDGPATASSPQFQFQLSRLVSELAPSTYGLVSALALAGLFAIRRVRHHSTALGGY